MAIAFVQNTSGTNTTGSTATTNTAAFGAAISVGNLIIVGVINDGAAGSVTSVTDTKGNSYSLIARNTSLTTVTTEIWAAVVTVGGTGNVVTANQGFNDGCIFAQEWSGITNGTVDQVGRGTGTSTTMTATTPATTVAAELVFACGEVDVVSTNTLTAGTGYTNFFALSSGTVRGAVESKVVSATGAQTATMTVASGTASNRIVVATFKAGTVPTIPPNLFFF